MITINRQNFDHYRQHLPKSAFLADTWVIGWKDFGAARLRLGEMVGECRSQVAKVVASINRFLHASNVETFSLASAYTDTVSHSTIYDEITPSEQGKEPDLLATIMQLLSEHYRGNPFTVYAESDIAVKVATGRRTVSEMLFPRSLEISFAFLADAQKTFEIKFSSPIATIFENCNDGLVRECCLLSRNLLRAGIRSEFTFDARSYNSLQQLLKKARNELPIRVELEQYEWLQRSMVILADDGYLPSNGNAHLCSLNCEFIRAIDALRGELNQF